MDSREGCKTGGVAGVEPSAPERREEGRTPNFCPGPKIDPAAPEKPCIRQDARFYFKKFAKTKPRQQDPVGTDMGKTARCKTGAAGRK